MKIVPDSELGTLESSKASDVKILCKLKDFFSVDCRNRWPVQGWSGGGPEPQPCDMKVIVQESSRVFSWTRSLDGRCKDGAKVGGLPGPLMMLFLQVRTSTDSLLFEGGGRKAGKRPSWACTTKVTFEPVREQGDYMGVIYVQDMRVLKVCGRDTLLWSINNSSKVGAHVMETFITLAVPCSPI